MESLSLLHHGLLDCWIVGLFVFGGCDPETGLDKYVDAFAGAFSTVQCVAAWEAVGVVPPTHPCLNDNHVCCELGDSSANGTIQIKVAKMQQANTMACNLLTAWGFQGHFLKAELKKKNEIVTASVTIVNSKERVEALAKTSTHGADMLTSAVMPAKKATISLVKKEKRG